jgi:hypothetical protein
LKKSSQKRGGRVAQGVGPESNPSTTKKKKRKRKKERKKKITQGQEGKEEVQVCHCTGL